MAHLSAKLYPLEPSSLTLEAVSKKCQAEGKGLVTNIASVFLTCTIHRDPAYGTPWC